MSSSSTSLRRVITRKRNALSALFDKADTLLDKDLSSLSGDELIRLSSEVVRTKSELSASLEVITENGKKWMKIIESIEDETTQRSEHSELEKYFQDTEDHPIKSIESIHDEVTSRSCCLDGLIGQIERLRLSPRAPSSAEQIAPSLSQPTPPVVVTQPAPVPLPALPNLTLQTFDGKGCWETYWRSFSEIIDKRSEIGESTKLRYLESSLTGEASDLFSHLLKRGCVYSEVVNGLQNEYKGTVKTHQHLLKEFGTLRPKNDSYEEQLRAIRNFETLIAQLKTQHADPDNNPFCLQNVIERFSPYCQKQVHLKMKESDGSSTFSLSEALSHLKGKLKDEIELRELCPRRPKNSPSSDTPVSAVTAQTGNKSKPAGKLVTERREGKERKERKERDSTAKSSALGTAGSAQMCFFCNTHTNPFACYVLKQTEKNDLLIQQGRCKKCFQQGHSADSCTKEDCSLCGYKHNFSVCYSFRYRKPRPKSYVPKADTAVLATSKSAESTPVPIATATSSDHIRMLTGGVSVSNPHSGSTERVDVFLDSGAGVTLLSATTRDRLALPTERVQCLDLSGLAGMSDGPRAYDIVRLSLTTNNGPMLVDAVVHSDPLTGSIPMATLSNADKQVLKDQRVQLVDSIHRKGRIQPRLLIGGKDFYRVTGMSDQRLPSGLFVINTLLGAMIAGEKETGANRPTSVPLMPISLSDGLDESHSVQEQMLSNFLSLDLAGKDDQMSTERTARLEKEIRVQEQFDKNIEFKDGHYHVRYAFNEKLEQLTDGFNQAWVRLKHMYKKIASDKGTLQAVDQIFKKQIDAGQIEIVENGTGGPHIRYIPLQLVVKESSETTPHRVVIDASAHGKNEPSLNDCLDGSGANFLEQIPKMLLRIQLNEVLFAGDIEKAFLQIKIFEDQRDLLRVLWLKDPLQPPSIDNLLVLRYCSAAFGIAQSPFMLMATLRHHANLRLEQINSERELARPTGSIDQKQCDEWDLEISVLQSLLNQCYVDNIFFKCAKDTDQEALFNMAKKVFKAMGMNIRSFFSSDSTFVQTLSKENGDQGAMGETKILGVGYDTTSDEWMLKCDLSYDRKITKRVIMSKLASVFNPMGHLIPLLLPAKIFAQRLWLKEYGWDDAIDDSDLPVWQKIAENAALSQFRLPRHIPMPNDVIHLALFTDGSHMAMGAVVYMWTPNGARFLMARNQLAPIRAPKTTPKLELQALVMGMNLLLYVTEAIAAEYHTVTFNFQVYTDATTLLHWLESCDHLDDPKRKNLGVFVTNRLRKIHQIQCGLSRYTVDHTDSSPTDHVDWIRYDHVAGTENPSDHTTRGLTAAEMSDPSHVWWNGPDWLSLPPDKWKREFSTRSKEAAISELQLTSAQSTTTSDDQVIPVLSVAKRRKGNNTPAIAMTDTVAPLDLIDMSRFSRFYKLRKAMAFVLRFIKLKCPITHSRSKLLRSPPQSGPPSKGELEKATIVLIRQHQRDNLSSWNNIPGAELSEDDNGVLRIKCRMDNAEIEETAKAPILLFAKNDDFPRLLITDTHLALMHRGTEHTLAELRKEYWLVKGRSIVKSVLRGCQICRKAYNRPYRYPPAPPLPPERIRESRPFQHLGIDMAGPIKLKNESDPSGDPQKGYVLLLTCMSTRLIHLEVTKDLSTFSFLNAFDRFIARRGAPDSITSDNAPTFKLADKLLRERWESFRSDHSILSFVSDHMIQWRWITAYSPWQGGFYEKLIGTVKAAFNSVFLRRALSMDEFQTQMAKVEAIINSRPLTHVSSDLQSSLELPVLRPCDFLAPKVRLAIPHCELNKDILNDPDYIPPSEISLSRKDLIDRFRKAEQSLDKFWELFRRHYVTELREHNLLHPMRTNYRAKAPAPFPHEIVLVVDENAPRGTWKMAKVIKVNERDVTLLSSTGKEISRPVNRIIPLELVSSDQSHPTNTGDSTRPVLRRSTRAAANKAREHISALQSDDESGSDEDNSFSRIRDRRENRKGGRMLEETLAGMPVNSVNNHFFPGQLRSHKRSSVRALTGPWSFSNLLTLTLMCLAIVVPVSSVHLECFQNGAKFHHENAFPPYQLCGDGDCLIIHPDSDSVVETTQFNPAHTLHGFTVSAKFLRAGSVQSLSLECPAFNFCESITCTFCLATLANPECNVTAALIALGMILYLVALVIYSVCYNPLVLSQPLIGICSVCCVISRFSLRCLAVPIHMCLRMARGRTAMQRPKLRTIIFLCFSILLTLSATRACQEVIELSGTARICEEGKCANVVTTILKLNPISREACIALTVNETVAGQLKIAIKDTSLRCDMENHGYHRDCEVKYVHAKRCPHTGSCKGPKCENVTSTSLIPELKEGNRFPGHTVCAESCGGVGCDCFWPSSGCLFYRTYCEPRSEVIYRTLECPTWRPMVTVEIALSIGNETTAETYSLRPNLRMKGAGPYQMELTNFAVPPLPLLSRPFIWSETDEKMALLTHHPVVLCNSKEEANTLNCTSEENCSCVTNENAAHCECTQSSLEENFHLDKVFPLMTPQMRIRSIKGLPVASLYQSVSTEVAITVRKDRIRMDHFEIIPIRCAISVSSFVGCYNCIRGARVIFNCLTREGQGLATIQCSRDSFTVPCDERGIRTERSLSFSTAAVNERCVSSCGDPIQITGVLKYTGIETDSTITDAISWNGTEISWPDFSHVGTVFLHYWMSTVICLAIVAVCVLLTILLLPMVIPLITTSLLTFGRRGSFKVAQKDL